MSSGNPKEDKLTTVKKQIDSVKGAMVSNIQLALKNTDKLEDVELGSANLLQSSRNFEHKSKQLKRAMCTRNLKVGVVVVIIVAFIITVAILSACKGTC